MTREVLLLVEKCSHCISYYDIASGNREASVALPDFPHEFVVDPQGRHAYIGHYGVETSGHLGEGGHSILQLDIAAREVVHTLDVSPYRRVHGLQMDRLGRLYALSESSATLLVFDRPAHATAPDRAVPAGGIKSHLFALSADGECAYTMNLLSHTVVKVWPHDPCRPPLACHPGSKPEGNCLSEDQRTLYVSNRLDNTLAAIDTQDMRVRLCVASRPDATRIYRAHDGSLLVTNYGDRSLSVVDPSSLRELRNIRLDARPIALSLHPTQALAFVSMDDDRLGYLDLNTYSFERWVTTQREPDVSRVMVL